MCLVRIDLLLWQRKDWDLLLQIHIDMLLWECKKHCCTYTNPKLLYIYSKNENALFTHPQVIIVLQKTKKNKNFKDIHTAFNFNSSFWGWVLTLISQFDFDSQACDSFRFLIQFDTDYFGYISGTHAKKNLSTNAVKCTWESVGNTLL